MNTSKRIAGRLAEIFSALTIGGALLASSASGATWWWNNYHFDNNQPYTNSWHPQFGVSVSFGAQPTYPCRTWDGWDWRYGYFDDSFGQCRYHERNTGRALVSGFFGVLSSQIQPRWLDRADYDRYWNFGWHPGPGFGVLLPFSANSGLEVFSNMADDSLKNICRTAVNDNYLSGMVIDGNCEIPFGNNVAVVNVNWQFPVFDQ